MGFHFEHILLGGYARWWAEPHSLGRNTTKLLQQIGEGFSGCNRSQYRCHAQLLVPTLPRVLLYTMASTFWQNASVRPANRLVLRKTAAAKRGDIDTRHPLWA